MTKLKEFRESVPSWMKMSMIDVLEMMDPSKTNKYLPMLVQVFDDSNSSRYNINVHEIKEYENALARKLPFIKDKIKSLDKKILFTIWHFIEQLRTNEVETMIEFIESYEKNQINNVDVNTLKDFQEIEKIVNLISLKNLGKEYSKQVSIELETEKWLVIRPLTYESSVKYGASTRWCTAAKNNPNQYFRYTENGVLIYCINRDTGVKTAFHCWIDSQKTPYDISFWNSADDRIDSLLSDLDSEVINILKKIITSSDVKSNKEIGGEFWTKSYDTNGEDEKISDPTREYIEDVRLNREVDFVEIQHENDEISRVYIFGDEPTQENHSDYEVVGTMNGGG